MGGNVKCNLLKDGAGIPIHASVYSVLALKTPCDYFIIFFMIVTNLDSPQDFDRPLGHFEGATWHSCRDFTLPLQSFIGLKACSFETEI